MKTESYKELKTISILNRLLKTVAFITFIVVILPIFEKIADATVVIWSSSYFRNTITFGILFSITGCIILIVIMYRIRVKDYKFPYYFYIALCTVLGLWIYYRFFNMIWDYSAILGSPVCYIDIFGIYPIAIILSQFIKKAKPFITKTFNKISSKNKEMTVQPLIIDSPISTEAEDLLNRKPFASNIAQHIVDLKTEDNSYSFAIISPWGNGKTSFINLIIKEIETHNGICILQFSPWHLNPNTSITQKFFQQVAIELDYFDYSLKNLVNKYSEILENVVPSSIWRLPKLWHREQPNDIFEAISKLLKSQKKKLLIIIDDIDRLYASEIEEIFRLIRGSANFPNFIFLCAFDKEYVLKTLSNSSSAITDNFIEKFFQVEFVLPTYDKEAFQRIIISNTKFLSETDQIKFKEYIESTQNFFDEPNPIYTLLPNIRAIYRWLNNIQVSYRILMDECNIEDLADIELMKLKFPDIYNCLKEDYRYYLDSKMGYYKLWKYDESKKDDYLYNLHKHKDLLKEEAYQKIGNDDKEQLNNILLRLLSGKEDKSFSDPHYTPIYFYGNLRYTDISDKEFKELLNRDYAEIKEKLENYKENRIESLWKRLRDFKTTDTDQARKILRIIFYMPKIYHNWTIDVISVVDRLSSLDISDDKRKSFLIELTQENGASISVANLFSTRMSYRGVIKEYLAKYITDDEADKIVLEMFQKALEEKLSLKKIDEFFILTIKDEYKRDEQRNLIKKSIYNPKADELFKEYIANNFANIINSLVLTDSNDTDKQSYVPYINFRRYWKTWAEFQGYCSQNGINIDNNAQVNEFIEFMNEYEKEGKTVKFDFHEIHPEI